MTALFKPIGLLNLSTDSTSLPTEYDGTNEVSGAMRRCKNLRLDEEGVAKTRNGYNILDSGLDININRIIEQAGSRYEFSGDEIYESGTSLISGLTDAQWSAILYNSYKSTNQNVFALNGTDRKRIEDSVVYEWGIEAPTVAPVLSIEYVTGLTGDYNAKYTYCRKEGSVVVAESDPSPAGTAVTLTDQSLKVEATPPTDPQVTHIRIYRTGTDGLIYYYDIDVSVSIGDYSYTFGWEGDGTTGTGTLIDDSMGYYVGYTYAFESDYLGMAFQFTQTPNTYNICFSWEGDYSVETTITNDTFTSQPYFLYSVQYVLTTLTYYISGTGVSLSAGLSGTNIYFYSWEATYTTLTNDIHETVKTGGEDPVISILFDVDTTLGTEVESDHDRPPAGSFVIGPNYNGTCFIIKDNLLYYCSPKQPEYWPTNNYIEVSPVQFPGQSAVFWSGQLYYFSKTEIYLIQGTGASTFFPIPMAAITGAQGIDCVVPVTGLGIYHVGSDGIYLFSNGNDKKVSQVFMERIFRGETVNGVPGVDRTKLSDSWLIEFNSRLYFGYCGTADTHPQNIIVIDLTTQKIWFYDYGIELSTVAIDKTNHNLLAGDTSGNVLKLEDVTITKDNGSDIAWEIETKEFTMQTRKHFPRWIKYDADASKAEATGEIIVDGVSLQSHTITGDRVTRRRLINTGNGDRVSLKITGSGPVSIHAMEFE